MKTRYPARDLQGMRQRDIRNTVEPAVPGGWCGRWGGATADAGGCS